MNAIKERIIGAITVMNEDDAQFVWDVIQVKIAPKSWDDIESISPDDLDLQMLEEMKKDTSCHDFVSSEDAMKELCL